MIEYFREAMELEEELLLEMSNVVGRFVKNPGKLDFSFFFSSSKGVSHQIRVKPLFNEEKINPYDAGSLELHGDWKFTPGKNDKSVSSKEIRRMKQFFRDRIVLFCLVWDRHLDDSMLEHYFLGDFSLRELIERLDFYSKNKEKLDNVNSVEELEKVCRENNLVNFYGN